MSMYADALKIARVICVLLQINFLLNNEKYVFFTFGAYYFAASAITRGIFSATKDYASPFDVDGVSPEDCSYTIQTGTGAMLSFFSPKRLQTCSSVFPFHSCSGTSALSLNIASIIWQRLAVDA
ncbi:hypothetical protein RDI58_017327 [Solanum bulbocastanum]|uniref:Uncharacterized protein n=1 Tax=Solanum bulbocastanum TaxID=147425 RepID=A0AAN8T8L3_SOLBU